MGSLGKLNSLVQKKKKKKGNRISTATILSDKNAQFSTTKSHKAYKETGIYDAVKWK